MNKIYIAANLSSLLADIHYLFSKSWLCHSSFTHCLSFHPFIRLSRFWTAKYRFLKSSRINRICFRYQLSCLSSSIFGNCILYLNTLSSCKVDFWIWLNLTLALQRLVHLYPEYLLFIPYISYPGRPPDDVVDEVVPNNITISHPRRGHVMNSNFNSCGPPGRRFFSICHCLTTIEKFRL